MGKGYDVMGKEIKKEFVGTLYCTEREKDGKIFGVLNVGGKLRAAECVRIGDTKDYNLVRWLGRTCRSDVAPRRHAQNAAFDGA